MYIVPANICNDDEYNWTGVARNWNEHLKLNAKKNYSDNFRVAHLHDLIDEMNPIE